MKKAERVNSDMHLVPRSTTGPAGSCASPRSSLKITDQMVFLCPDNPSLKLADVDLVSRWYRTADGSIHGRSDAMMTGGQLPDTLDPTTNAYDLSRIVGVTCHQS